MIVKLYFFVFSLPLFLNKLIYFSCTGTTEPLAEYAAEILGADIYEIVPSEPYTEADLAYYTNGRADKEQNDPKARPEISVNMENMDNYDTMILGYPIWHGQAPKIIYTFLESYDLSDKTIAPFCTSHSSGTAYVHLVWFTLILSVYFKFRRQDRNYISQ